MRTLAGRKSGPGSFPCGGIRRALNMDRCWPQLLQNGFSPKPFLGDVVILGFVRVAQCILSEIMAGRELPRVPFLLNG